ncbi:MAG: DUF687 family protein [Chlamydiales bacterium]|nr:DUF687 family protein [Chlamydiales bacterium]
MRFFLLLLFTSSLFAETKIDDARENYFLQETPVSILPNVDPVTGTYMEESTDLVVAGIEPIAIRRFYYSMAPNNARYGNWEFNPETTLTANFEWKHQSFYASVGTSAGGMLKLDCVAEGRFECRSRASNFTLSGQHHPENVKLQYEKIFDMKDPDRFQWFGTVEDGAGVVRTFCSPMHRWFRKKRERTKETKAWGATEWSETTYTPNRWTPYEIPVLQATLPNGNSLHYEYEDWVDSSLWPHPRLLKRITAKNRDGEVLGWAEFCYTRDPKDKDVITKVEIVGSDGRVARISQTLDDSFSTIRKVERPGQPPISYKYDGRELVEVALPDGRIYKTEYDEKGRVKQQEGPYGIIATYQYKNQHTIVTDAEGHKTIYRYDQHNRVTEVERGGSIEKKKWSREGDLIHFSIWNKSGADLTATDYHYEEHNPVLERTMRKCTRRKYENNRVVEEECSDRKKTFKYDGSLLLEECLFEDGHLLRKTTNQYDKSGCLTQSCDGEKVTRIKPKKSLPCRGLPEEVIEEDLKGKLIHRTVYTYAPCGKVTSEAHYDADNNHCYTLHNQYKNELLVRSIDALGNATHFKYDNNHNLVMVNDKGHKKRFTYDKENRLIAIDDEGLITKRSFDRIGNLIAQTDPCGHTTKYTHDLHGRITAIEYPNRSIHTKKYDPIGNLIEESDGKGYTTLRKYDRDNRLTHIFHPDGSKEIFIHNTHGNVIEHLDRAGTRTFYSYDALDRVISTRIGEFGKTKESFAYYSPFRLVAEMDPAGTRTEYTYNSFGQKVSQTREGTTTKFTYDKLGRCTQVQQGNTSEISLFDLLGRLIEKRVEEDKLLECEKYRYDKHGNRVETITSKGAFIVQYNKHNQPICEIDPLGNKTQYLYEAQRLVAEVNPNGTATHYTHNEMGQPILIVKKDANGEVLHEVKKKYDPNSNCIEEQVLIYEGTKFSRPHFYQFEYGPFNLLQVDRELGRGETHYHYDLAGRLHTTIKPNGDALKREYDIFGCLVRYRSHDFDYRYTYDPLDNLLTVYDAVTGQTTTRNYDNNGNLTTETLGNGLSLRNDYNTKNERERVTLPDNTTIEYRYQGNFLYTVNRNGLHTYTHDLDGAITAIAHPNANITITRDALSRPIAISAPHYNFTYEYDKNGNLIRDGTKHYSYDALDQLIQDEAHTYCYDSLNGRTRKDDQKFSLTSCGRNLDCKYDLNGNLLENELWKFSYDSLDRLTSAQNKHVEIQYTYDPFNRRLSKKTYVQNRRTATILYLWDGENEIGATDENHNITQLRVLGEGLGAEIGAAVQHELDGQIYTPIFDHRGNLVVHLGPTIQTCDYTGFGEESSPDCCSPWRFASKRCDVETGLIYFGRRYYAPSIGTWITTDPKGRTDGPNLYVYVHANPLTNIDLYGLTAAETNLIWNTDLDAECFHFSQKANRPTNYHTNFETNFSNKSFLYNVGNNAANASGIHYINGVGNSTNLASSNRLHISNLSGGMNIGGVYNATHSLPVDVFEAGLNLFRVVHTEPVRLIKEHFEMDVKNGPPEAFFLYIAHSHGVIEIRNALIDSPEEIRRRIRVVAIAPAAYIDEDLCHSVVHYRAEGCRDFVPHIDRAGRNRNRHTTVILKSKTRSAWDHSFQSPTYRNALKHEIDKYNEQTKAWQ